MLRLREGKLSDRNTMSRNAAQSGVAADELLAVARTSQLNANIVSGRENGSVKARVEPIAISRAATKCSSEAHLRITKKA